MVLLALGGFWWMNGGTAKALPAQPTLVNRRNILKVVAGTAVAGEAAAVGYSWVNAGPASNAPAGGVVAAPQRAPIVRQMTDSKADVGGRSLGRWILLLPTKLGGGTYAIDLHSNRVLASIWYWTYGDYNPISHHLCAFPSADPYRTFEFVNSTQGGKNCLIYGIPTRMEAPEPGFNIYRVRYDGAQMEAAQEEARYEAMSEKQIAREIKALEKKMLAHAKNLEFEEAAKIRDQLTELKKKVFGVEAAEF